MNIKSANEVLSMLFYVLELQKRHHSFKTVPLHADNSAGQNKKTIRSLLFVMPGKYVCGSYIFLIAGHTKNICDDDFGNVKRLYRASNVYNTAENFNVIQRSVETFGWITGTSVRWRFWKKVLEWYFTVPSTLQVPKYHCFTFRKQNFSSVYVKKLCC